MTAQQQLAFEQLPSMRLVSPTIEGRRGALVALTDARLYVLSPAGLLSPMKTQGGARV